MERKNKACDDCAWYQNRRSEQLCRKTGKRKAATCCGVAMPYKKFDCLRWAGGLKNHKHCEKTAIKQRLAFVRNGKF